MKRIYSFFELKELKTNIRTEIIAGLSTFLALSYIFVVNPAILSEGGMNKSAVLFATVITSALATLFMGFWAKKPFALAPGLEMNSYVVYYVILTLGFSWQSSLGIVFWSGVLFMIFTLTKIREKIIHAIPEKLKTGLSASVGVFLMLIALKISGLIVYDGISIHDFSSPFTKPFYVFLVGLALVVLLDKFKLKVFILISIIGAAIFAHLIGLDISSREKVVISREMFGAIMQLDFSAIFEPKLLSALIILFVIDFYGSVAKFLGFTRGTTMLDSKGNMPKMKEALTVDGVASMAGATLGTTSVTVYVESAAGISVGGRSGLTAIICALLMFLFIPLAPIVNLVPVEATTGALLMIGLKMFPKISEIKNWNSIEIISVLCMIIVTFLTFSLDKALAVGFLFYILGLLFNGKRKEINLYLVISTLLIFVAIILSIYG
ncbi:MAG: NCS2 family permease [Dysgonamonadaceae bacterium]|nr:NCS2 family permease [Dysgonamonadaceae bacterium]